MKKYLLFVLAMVMLLVFNTTAFASGIPFTDVPQDAWYYSDVESAYTDGLINGKSDTEFAPDDNLTYAEAVKLAACMHMVATIGEASFEAREPWYQIYVDYAKRNKIIEGNFNWDEPATRAGYMTIFANAIPDTASGTVSALAEVNQVPDGLIPDVPMTHPQAAAIYKLYRAGILQGNDDKYSCEPNSNIKRSEVAAILTRMMKADKRIRFNAGAGEPVATPVPTAGAISTPSPSSGGNSGGGSGSGGGTRPTPTPTPTPKPGDSGQSQSGSLVITEQPTDIENATGEEIIFTVTVSGGKAPYNYKWESCCDGEKWDSAEKINSFDTTSEFVVEAYDEDESWRCTIEDADGNVVVTDEVTVYFANRGDDLEIAIQPVVCIDCIDGGDAEYFVIVKGGKGPYTFVWESCIMDEWNVVFEETIDERTSLFIDKFVSYANSEIVRCTITDANGDSVTTDEVWAEFVR